jgi:site-specific DNA-adenine methylase
MTTPAIPLPDLAARIEAEHAACLAAAQDAVMRAIEVGRLLAEAKGRIRHGEWAGWVEANCPFGIREAQNYMRAYQERGRLEEQMRNGVSHLTGLRGAVAALAAPRDVDNDGALDGWLFPEAGPPGAETSSPDRPDSGGIRGSASTPIVWKKAKGAGIAPLRAPFWYFGGKRPAARFVWAALGDPQNFVEPFCGSAAVFFARPHPPRVETINDPSLLVDNFQRATHAEHGDVDGAALAFAEAINDLDPDVANVWRATRSAPEEVARWADHPVNESYLHAVHGYLVEGDDAARFRERMRSDPDFFDPIRAGRWVYGTCLWVGSGWCHPGATRHRKRPRLHAARQGDDHRFGGLGVHADRPPKFLGRDGHDNGAAGSCEWRRGWIVAWLRRIRDRLRHVRVCCGDWRRTCNSGSTTTELGPTGIFFDPPYSAEAGRCQELYGVDSLTVAHSVRDYCREWGPNPSMRIVLAGYAGEGHEVLEREGWSVLAWNNSRGYGNRTPAGRERAGRERLWLSPHCRPIS